MSENTAVATKTKTKLGKPSKFKVILHNDDFTPMDFVVAVLTQIFGHTEEMAVTIMMHIHNHKRGVAGIFTYEIAKQKQTETHRAARNYHHPLKVTLEEALE
jgi:ATP-dependent Clp protease adaptor protein ClpS